MKKITLNKKMFITILMLLLIQAGWSQSSPCIVYDDITLEERAALGISAQELLMNKNTSLSPKSILSVPNNYTITPKQFRINFYSELGTSDHDVTVNTNYNLILKYLERLNRLYEPYQICFILNEVKDYYWHLVRPYSSDAINVYIQKKLDGGAHGIANYFSNIIRVKESAMWSEKALLAHEIGHAFGLMHTHGDFNRPPIGNCYNTNFSTNCEHVTRDPNDPDYNATTKGDLVHDTAADPGLFTNNSTNYPNCKNVDSAGNYIGNQVDCQGTPYALDTSVLKNIMAYNDDNHRILLTQGQVERMHYGIDTADSLNGIKRSIITNPDDSFDLVLRNSKLDYGFEPDTISTIFWNSPDIWVRPTNDNSIYHDNPIFGVGYNFVKVRIANHGCVPSDGTGKLKLYWTKAGTNLPMQVWNGSISLNGVSMGGLIGEADLPVLNSYEEHIFTFPWSVPNPDDFSAIDEPWHFCLMAKIETPNDVSALPEHNGTYYHYLNSNNIALHNVNVMKTTATNSGKIHIGNFEPKSQNVKLKLSRYKHDLIDTNIFEVAEVKFSFDDKLWDIWEESGFEGTEFEFWGDKTIIINENSEIFLNNFPANDFGLLNVKVNFLTTAYTSHTDFGFNVEHWDQNTNTLIGGELYLVNKEERDLFSADGFLEGTTLHAVTINEPAIYNWYNSDREFVHSGESFIISKNDIYLLEVIAEYDGFKDYAEIDATNISVFKNTYPNPANENVTIEYDTLNCNHAYIMLVNINDNSTTYYALDTNNSQITIGLSSFLAGLYRVVLVCDNNVMESQNLIIQ